METVILKESCPQQSKVRVSCPPPPPPPKNTIIETVAIKESCHQQSKVDPAAAAHVPRNGPKRPANEAFNKMNPTNSTSQEEPVEWVEQMICKTPKISHEEFANLMSNAVPPAQSPTSPTDESLQLQTDSHAAPATPKLKTNNVDPPTHTPTHTQAATESKKSMSEPELLVNAFQAKTWKKGEFDFATSLPYWESIHTKFQGVWGKGFTKNDRTTTKSLTYKATYKESFPCEHCPTT